MCVTCLLLVDDDCSLLTNDTIAQFSQHSLALRINLTKITCTTINKTVQEPDNIQSNQAS